MRKILKYAGKTAGSVFITTSLYLSALYQTQTISMITSPKINSQSHLEQILEGEKKRAGIKSNVNVRVKLVDKTKAESWITFGEDYGLVHEIILGGECQRLSVLRHELYHVADGHLESYDWFTYTFWEEPKATIYQITGLKP